MAGQIKQLLDTLINKRSKGNSVIASTTIAKLTLKGINPNNYTSTSIDDEAVIKRIYEISHEMGITL